MPSTFRTTLFVALAALLIPPGWYMHHRLSLFGAFRQSFQTASSFVSSNSDDIFRIEGIFQAEDLAYHESSGLVIVAGQGGWESRFRWWPAWAVFEDPSKAKDADGGLWVIDPKTWETTRLVLDGFDVPFVTHGLDIHFEPSNLSSIYIYVVNHPPLLDPNTHEPLPISDSRVEIFHLDLSSSPLTATHLRSVKHPLVQTPNDVVALSRDEFLVTNDHENRQGLKRSLEDFLTFSPNSKTTIVRVRVDLDDCNGGDVRAEVVLDGLHNANGLHRGPDGTILHCDASGAVFTIFSLTRSTADKDDTIKLTQLDSLAMPNTLDNPTYYVNSDSTPTYVLAGLLKGIKLDEYSRDPESKIPTGVWAVKKDQDGQWVKKHLVEDDGEWVSGASVGMIIPIEQKEDIREAGAQVVFEGGDIKEGRNKQGWLLVTGPYSRGIGVIKVDLDW
ncbi:hypothetical protein CI109_107399 [Kwoniella shandongensis]|uniref:Uncharacterized protein n=1 Tax=Kwoniella shandongensis TaxID=1734106 RepID=A0A5M6BVM2_9TREE|nr:uncharacterized protein CI109_004673 [Kwoniella shandongensis]KAA5526897.1 hypothetical protein CI109_004673 [Kwoniella shandongensis]